MNFDLEKILESKRVLRRRLAVLPITEKLRMLDAMRERAVAMRQKNRDGSRNDIARRSVGTKRR